VLEVRDHPAVVALALAAWAGWELWRAYQA